MCALQCPKVRWRQCEACQRRLREAALEDEYHLQSWFVGRINTFLKAQGRKLIGWDEILEGGLSPGAIVMSWRVSLCPFVIDACIFDVCPALFWGVVFQSAE
jgi:N-acetyl-beta-hexosaminidase